MGTLDALRFVNLSGTRSSSSSSSSLLRCHNRPSFVAHQHRRSLRVLSVNSLACSRRNIIFNMGAVFSAQCSAPPAGAGGPPPGRPSNNSWRNWAIGVLLSIVLPLAHNKWGKFLAIKNEVETVVKTVETVVEVVEKVAEEVAEVADEVAEHLPEGGKFKSVIGIVENVAKETAKDAHIADQFIEEAEEVEKEIGSILVAEEHEMNTEATMEVSQDQDIKDGNQPN